MTGASQFPPPVALAKVLDRVRGRHPFLLGGGLDLSHPRVAAELSELQRWLEGLAPVALPAAVQGLSQRQVRMLLDALPDPLGDAPAPVLLRLLFELRSDSFLGERAFDLYVGSNGDPVFHRAAATRVQPPALFPVLWAELVAHDEPLGLLMERWRASGRGLTAWLQLPTVGLLPRTRLMPRLIRFLAACAPEQGWMERMEGDAVMVEWGMTQVPTDRRESWFARYLNRMGAEPILGPVNPLHGWPLEHRLLLHVRHTYRRPDEGMPFWEAVSAAARQRFQYWTTERELAHHLGDGERTAFWCNYLPGISFSELNVDRRVVLIHLKGWVALVFKDPGTATHLVAQRQAYGMQTKNANQLRAHLYGRVEVLGKYSHHGYTETWQENAAEEVARVQRMVNGLEHRGSP